MGEPLFRLALIDARTGEIAQFAPGEKIERDFRADLRDALAKRGVGLFRTTGHVLDDLDGAIDDAFSQVKKQARRLV